jgi:hypothetical protein
MLGLRLLTGVFGTDEIPMLGGTEFHRATVVYPQAYPQGELGGLTPLRSRRLTRRVEYNIVGDSLARRFARTLHGDVEEVVHRRGYDSFAVPHLRWAWAGKITEIEQHLKEKPWVNVVMLGIHDVYYTGSTAQWDSMESVRQLIGPHIQRVCQRENVLWRLAPEPWCHGRTRTLDALTIRDRLGRLNSIVREQCGSKAFKVPAGNDPGDSCEHFGRRFRQLEIDALESLTDFQYFPASRVLSGFAREVVDVMSRCGDPLRCPYGFSIVDVKHTEYVHDRNCNTRRFT